MVLEVLTLEAVTEGAASVQFEQGGGSKSGTMFGGIMTTFLITGGGQAAIGTPGVCRSGASLFVR